MNGMKDCVKQVDVKTMRNTMKASLDDACTVAQGAKSRAQEIRDRLFGTTEPSPDKTPATTERPSPTVVTYITSEGFSDLREIQGGTVRILDDILSKL